MFPGTFETNPHKSKHETTNLRNVLHWVTTLLLAPILLMGYEQMTSSGMIRNAHGIVVLFWGLGFIFSAPIFALYLIIFKFLLKKTKSRLIIKAVLNMVGVMSIAIIFLLILKGSTAMELMMTYSISLIICSLFLPIENTKLGLEKTSN